MSSFDFFPPNHEYGYTRSHLKHELVKLGPNYFSDFLKRLGGRTIMQDGQLNETVFLTNHVKTFLEQKENWSNESNN